jgi:hypothetical protein
VLGACVGSSVGGVGRAQRPTLPPYYYSDDSVGLALRRLRLTLAIQQELTNRNSINLTPHLLTYPNETT